MVVVAQLECRGRVAAVERLLCGRDHADTGYAIGVKVGAAASALAALPSRPTVQVALASRQERLVFDKRFVWILARPHFQRMLSSLTQSQGS